ncbi:tRNA-binding protein [Lysobacter sp. 5GHs7-4]|uniref:tRNA-binding protein n=1 Tax=Lysobacter sp. 5GHs7-4 TaxID=2904253 RepID=UPI001E420F93|nr:tRNA-binding protein [Lysobacter sp. 5GHs7-4]UHQ21378.1 tRNA-binding protein [Lysobacter sp. 5GHs7-4]
MSEQQETVAYGDLSWSEFEKVMLCAGTVLQVEEFPEARKPAWKLWVDFGPHGVRKTSAQVKQLYTAQELIGRQIVGVINFPAKQIGPFRSEFLLTGFPTQEGVVITAIERPVPNGTRLA